MEKNWAFSVDQCWLQALQFLVHLINLLSIFLRCIGFTRIQKASVDQTSSRPPNSDHEPLFWCKLGFGKCFGASLSIHWAGHCQLSYKLVFVVGHKTGSLLLCRIREGDIAKWWFFFKIFGQFMRHLLLEPFHLSNWLQMPNNHRMSDAELFRNFSCRCKRTSFNDPLSWLFSISDGQTLHFSSSRFWSPFQNFFLEPLLHCTFDGSSWVKCVADACKLSSLLYEAFWTQIRKLLEFAFCLTSFP